MKCKYTKYLVIFSIALALILFLIGFLNFIFERMRLLPAARFGVTFSNQYATSLGLDSKETFTALLDDLGVRAFRVPVYWEDVEQNQGVYDFSDMDWLVDEAGRRNAKIIMAVGYKLPRWPECHAPDWAKRLPPDERHAPVLALIGAIVNRYKSNQAIIAWQVENEPFFESFGECPKKDYNFFKQEVDLVRSLDSRSIIITESGELSFWSRVVKYTDVLGISLYRVSWNKYLGYIYYPLSPGFYRFRTWSVSNLFRRIIVTELQTEPWTPRGIMNSTLEEQMKSMNLDRLKNNINFVRRAGFTDIYLWGVEWWYWLKVKNDDSSFWDFGRELFRQSPPPPEIY